jgi:hypothetical protein
LTRRLLAVVVLLSSIAIPCLPAPPTRYALVIGNRSYRHGPLGGLRHAKADATSVAAALRSVGFEVRAVIDANAATLRAAIEAFRVDAREHAEMAIVYYSGHGLEFGGYNYLVPVDWPGASCREGDLPEASLQTLLRQLADDNVRYRLMVLDACRTAQTCARGRRPDPGGQRPLSPGDLIVFASGANEEAPDRRDFSKALVRAIVAGPDRDVREVFAEVQRAVSARGKQRPVIEERLAAPGSVAFRPSTQPTSSPSP